MNPSGHIPHGYGYFPSISSFSFSSAFIFLIVGSWLVDPVSCGLVAGGAVLVTRFRRDVPSQAASLWSSQDYRRQAQSGRTAGGSAGWVDPRMNRREAIDCNKG